MHALSLLALLLPLAAAHEHYHCGCMSWSPGQNWIHDSALAHYVCFNNYADQAIWNARDGLCLAKPGFKLSGQPWEDACKAATGEFYPVVTDPYGNESLDKSKKLTVGAATGWCPDKLE
ncbi:hypothetical protein E4U39_004129 [Claviceps sp. Clav50 group G5]|nr:hypothetical protein E4U39_004129 [Claviceps sp. Clav50 group G5]